MSLSMLNQSVASMARVPGGKYHDIKEKLWGIELTKDKPESTWKPEVSWSVWHCKMGRSDLDLFHGWCGLFPLFF